MDEKSLGHVHASVPVTHTSFWRRLLSFSGPAFLVSVGYMDPGNWATDIAGGSRFGYRLIWVILAANLIAILFQTLAARLGIVMGRDIAQACRDHYPRPVSIMLWILCEIAIVATDLAEVLGSAIGLYLIFGLPLIWGVIITAFDVMLLLLFESFGIRKIEAFIITLVATIGLCFAIEMVISHPHLGSIMAGFVPTPLTGGMLYVALGIFGATVMPHNLYLHSALVQTRAVSRTPQGLRQATRFNLIDSIVALNGAFLVNASILILAAATFFKSGQHQVESIIDAHRMLTPILGSGIAPMAFAIALLASGQSSTITGTYAGQIVMEGFIGWRIRPWLRRLITRLLAIIPAVLAIHLIGTGAADTLLILSQVILSLQLPFALVPLLHFTSDKTKMHEFASPFWLKTLAWPATILLLILNIKLIIGVFNDSVTTGGRAASMAKFLLLPLTILLLPFITWLIVEPWLRKQPLIKIKKILAPLLHLPKIAAYTPASRIGIALEVHHPGRDQKIITAALPLLGSFKPEIVLIHVVESAIARMIGPTANDAEVDADDQYLQQITEQLLSAGFQATVRIGSGEPAREIVRIAEAEKLDMIILGSHGHKLVSDLILGSTIPGVRHNTHIPVLAIPL